jgi:bifunctional non-homologous end joining protein LigD
MFEFRAPTRATRVPSGPDWLPQIKLDGYRILVIRENDRARLITRGGYWADRYP